MDALNDTRNLFSQFEPVDDASRRDWAERLANYRRELASGAAEAIQRQRVRQARTTRLSLTRVLG